MKRPYIVLLFAFTSICSALCIDENNMFCANEKSESNIPIAFGQDQYEAFQKSMISLQSKLASDESDIVLFTLGAGDEKAQEQPSYIFDLAKRFPNKKVSIYSIEMLKESVSIQLDKNIFLHRLQTFIPTSEKHFIVDVIRKFIENRLSETDSLGGNKTVFIGNHTRAERFSDVAMFINIFLKLKPSHKENIFFYNQVDGNPWFLFYPPENSSYVIKKSTRFFELDEPEERVFGTPSFQITEEIPYTTFENEKDFQGALLK